MTVAARWRRDVRAARSPSVRAACLGLALSVLAWPGRARADEASAASTPAPQATGATSTKIIPLPVFATLPNEGNTYGVLPVFLVVEDQRTRAIYAPSVTWNDVIGLTSTMRWFYYPAPAQALTLRVSASQRVNLQGLLIWVDRPREPGRWTDEALFRVERNVFYRFFGLGPDTRAAAETTYTRVHAQLELRRGLNLGSNFNLGARLSPAVDNTVLRGVPGLPNSQRVFPTAPGIDGAAAVGAGFELRYDSRPSYEFSRSGLFSALSTRWFYGVANSPSFARFEYEARGLLQELDWLQLGVRTYASFVSARDAPFYYQSSLGGSNLMRGFTEDRFIDRGAWTLEAEQRIRLFTTHIFGVKAEWRIDPFIAAGQVFSEREQIFSHVRIAEGVGFRALVQPNVLGRVDVAMAGEGLKVYVELGYPY
jgi:hypothetical protein